MFLIVLRKIFFANIFFYLFIFIDVAFLKSERGKKVVAFLHCLFLSSPSSYPNFTTHSLQAHAHAVKAQINAKTL